MARRAAKRAAVRADSLPSLPPLPLDANHWRAVVAAMELSEQHARVLALVLCDFSNKQIATTLNLGEGTVKDYLKRIARRTGTRGRMQLAVHVLTVSHQVLGKQEPK